MDSDYIIERLRFGDDPRALWELLLDEVGKERASRLWLEANSAFDASAQTG